MTICPKSGLRKATPQTLIDWRNSKAQPMTPPPSNALDAGQASSKGYATVNLTKTAKRVLETRRDDYTRQDTPKRIHAIRQAIEGDLVYLGNLIRHRKTDKAFQVMAAIMKKRGDMLALAEKYHAGLQAEPVPAPETKPRQASHKVTVKRKVYKTWAND